jgi:hypothetical protein
MDLFLFCFYLRNISPFLYLTSLFYKGIDHHLSLNTRDRTIRERSIPELGTKSQDEGVSETWPNKRKQIKHAISLTVVVFYTVNE